MKARQSSHHSALLIDAPVGRHFAQLHRDPASQADSVSLYIETGLRRGNSVLVVATPDNAQRYLSRLVAQGIEPELYIRCGQLEMLDAEATMSQFMRGGMPDWALFRHSVGAVLERLETSGLSSTRACGEMVNVLWQSGEVQAAIRLEEYWNDLAKIYPFSLFCTYMMDSHDPACYAHPIHQIGHTHSDIIPTDDDAEFRVALDAASKDIFGSALSDLVGLADVSGHPGEERLPPGQRTMLWLMRHQPASSNAVLERARRYAEV